MPTPRSGNAPSTFVHASRNSESIQARLRSAELFSIPLLSDTAVVQRSPAGLEAEAQRRVFERAPAGQRRRGLGLG